MGFQIENGVLEKYREESGVTEVVIPDGVTSIGGWAFFDCYNLTSITIPDSVTSIGDKAFYGCRSLTSITIPDSVTTIGDSAFRGCSSLTSITLPEGVTSIGRSVFSGCKKLCDKNGDIIVNHVYYYCYGNKKEKKIPSGVKKIWPYAFERNGLTAITIPDSVTSIGKGAFRKCSKLTTVKILGNVQHVEDGIFEKSGIKHVIFEEGVTSIPDQMFYRIDSLESVEFPETLVSIGDEAFFLCSGLTGLVFPAGLQSVGKSAFSGCRGLKSIQCYRDGSVIAEAIGRLVEPDAMIEFFGTLPPISEFKEATHKMPFLKGYLKNRARYTEQESIADIEKYIVSQKKKVLQLAFEMDEGYIMDVFARLKKLTAKNIDSEFLEPAMAAGATQCTAFLLDWKGKNVTVQQQDKLFERELMKDPYNAEDMKKLWSTKKLPDGTLLLTNYKGNEENVVLPERIGKTAVSAFEPDLFSCEKKGCSKEVRANLAKIKSIHIPDTIHIHDQGKVDFRGCRGLCDENGDLIFREIYCCYSGNDIEKRIPVGVTTIGCGAFSDCSSLRSVTIPDGVKTIYDYAFSDCRSLTSITLPEGVTSIGEGAFSDCYNLTSITLPEGVTSIAGGAFSGCSRLTSITIPASVTSIGDRAFYYCRRLTSITLPEGVTSIGEGAFSDCYNLTSITIPDSVTSIGDRAFYDCSSLTSITIPDSVTSIGGWAFSDCYNL